MNSAALPGSAAAGRRRGGSPTLRDVPGRPPPRSRSGRLGPLAARRPQRALKHKRWLYCFMATPEVAAYFAIVDLAYTSNAFALVVDLRRKQVLVDAGSCRPRAAGEGERSARRGAGGLVPGPRRAAGRDPARGDVALPRPRRRARLLPYPKRELPGRESCSRVGGPPPLTVVAPVARDGVVNVTQKWAGLLAFGTLRSAGAASTLDGGVGGLDYTHGYLARRTAWRWAFACGRLADGTPIGLNLVEGFNESTPTRTRTRCGWAAGCPAARARASTSTRPTRSTDGRSAPTTARWSSTSAPSAPTARSGT